jgi:hypothetical protein
LEKEMLLLLLVRRLSPRNRAIVGSLFVAGGLALVAVTGLAVGMLIHAAVLAVIGAVLCTSAVVGRRRA